MARLATARHGQNHSGMLCRRCSSGPTRARAPALPEDATGNSETTFSKVPDNNRIATGCCCRSSRLREQGEARRGDADRTRPDCDTNMQTKVMRTGRADRVQSGSPRYLEEEQTSWGFKRGPRRAHAKTLAAPGRGRLAADAKLKQDNRMRTAKTGTIDGRQ